MKYLVGELNAKYGSVLGAIIFPEYMEHDRMASAFVGHKPESGGFVRLNADGEPCAYGESVSLDLKSNPERDNKLLKRLLTTTY